MLLKARGFDPGPADGVAGPQTINAIRSYQQARRLEVNGVPSPQLLAALAADPDRAPQGPADPPRPQRPMRETGSGSGFVVNGDGDVITNEHVLRGCAAARIEWPGAEATTARIVHSDRAADLVLLRTEKKAQGWARLRSGTPAREGESIVVLGYPLAPILGNRLNATTGNIASVAGVGNDSAVMTITAPVQPGSSGGPLLDMHGLVVGVIFSGLGDRFQRATGVMPQNVNFALKASVIELFLTTNAVAFDKALPQGERAAAPDVVDSGRKYTVRVACLKPM